MYCSSPGHRSRRPEAGAELPEEGKTKTVILYSLHFQRFSNRRKWRHLTHRDVAKYMILGRFCLKHLLLAQEHKPVLYHGNSELIRVSLLNLNKAGNGTKTTTIAFEIDRL